MFATENFISYCINGDIEGVKWCIEKGVDVNIRKLYGSTGFDYTCEMGNIEIVKLFLNIENINENYKGYNLFYWYSIINDKKILKLLLDDIEINVIPRSKNCNTNRSLEKYYVKNSIKDNVEFNIN